MSKRDDPYILTSRLIDTLQGSRNRRMKDSVFALFTPTEIENAGARLPLAKMHSTVSP